MRRRRTGRSYALVAALFVAGLGCDNGAPAPPVRRGPSPGPTTMPTAVAAPTTTPIASPAPTATADGSAARRTTDGAIAVGNLDAQIAGNERIARNRSLSVKERASQAELLTLRGQVLGRVSDYEAAAAIAEGLVQEAPGDPVAWLARARSRTTFHRFADALADLEKAAAHGALPNAVEAVRVGILQATGKETEALPIRRRLSEARPDILNLGAEATLLAARGDLDGAERLFAEAIASYRDVSPFPVTWVEFQNGLVWMREEQFERARTLLATAHRRLPQHAQAQGHLGEVEAALGHVDEAVAVLQPLAETSEDPDYAAQLARVLTEAGRAGEAKPWRERAAARYDALTKKHPEAYADHAAEFWLAAGADPKRALQYAERNLQLRPTVRAWELVLRAAHAAGDGRRACEAAAGARAAGYLYASARKAVEEVAAQCPGHAE